MDLATVLGVEPLLDRLDLPEEALANLAHLSGVDAEAFREGDGWAAQVELDGDTLWIAGVTDRWRIALPAGADEADAARTARRLHGLLGAIGEGWDLDR